MIFHHLIILYLISADVIDSGAPQSGHPLGPSDSGRIIEVSSFQGLLIQRGCGP